MMELDARIESVTELEAVIRSMDRLISGQVTAEELAGLTDDLLLARRCIQKRIESLKLRSTLPTPAELEAAINGWKQARQGRTG